MVEQGSHKTETWVQFPPPAQNMGGVAQLARALACRAKGYEFEPRRPRLRLAEVRR